MSRLYDRIMASKTLKTDYDKSVIRGATVVDASDVFSSININSVSEQYWKDVPSFAPPFHNMLIEARIPNSNPFYACGLRLVVQPDAKKGLWNLMHFYEDMKGGAPGGLTHDELGKMYNLIIDGSPDMKWTMGIEVWVEPQKGNPFVAAMSWIVVNADGTMAKTMRIWVPTESYFSTNTSQEEAVQMMDTLEALLYPLTYSLSLINCKNVELIDTVPPPKLSQRHQKEHGEPLVIFKTIKVNPMRVMKHSTDLNAPKDHSVKPEADQPLSIWRGHFKDYRDGKGLFGKFKSIYWWDQHVRGSIENGAVIKDYDVQAPDGQSS